MRKTKLCGQRSEGPGFESHPELDGYFIKPYQRSFLVPIQVNLVQNILSKNIKISDQTLDEPRQLLPHLMHCSFHIMFRHALTDREPN